MMTNIQLILTMTPKSIRSVFLDVPFILVTVGIRSKARNEMLTILAKNESPIITPDMKNPLRLYVEKKNADSESNR